MMEKISTHPLVVSLVEKISAHPLAVSLTLKCITIIVASMLLAVSAKFKITLGPVPFTMQVFALMVIAYTLGARWGVATVLLYLTQGALGLDVFAAPERGLGLAYLLGPTGGYLLGFVVAVALGGVLFARGWGALWWQRALVAVGMLVPIYLLGAGWLILGIGLEASQAFLGGVQPFIIPDVLKAIAFALLPLSRVRKGFRQI